MFSILIDSSSLNTISLLLPHLSQIIERTNVLSKNIRYFRGLEFSILIALDAIEFFHAHLFRIYPKKEVLSFELSKVFQFYFIIVLIFVRRK